MDPKFLGHYFLDSKTFLEPETFFETIKINFEPKNFFDTKTFSDLKLFYFAQKLFLDPKFSFGQKNFRTNIFFTQNIFGLKTFSDQHFFDPKRSILNLCYKHTKPKFFEQKIFQAEHFRPKSFYL